MQEYPKALTDLTFTFNYNDIQSVIDSIDDETAAVILEPFVFEEPKNNFLLELREVCTKNGTLLIFDEMWTGFRIALGGAQEFFKVNADLATFSKAVANGMPISVLTGKSRCNESSWKRMFSSIQLLVVKHLSLAAAKATITELRKNNVPAYLVNTR